MTNEHRRGTADAGGAGNGEDRAAASGRAADVRDRLWTPPFILLLVSATFMYMMTFMLTPTLPLFAQDIGAGTAAAGGVIVAAYTLGSLLPRLVWGRLVDTRGRQLVYLIGIIIMLVISPLYTIAAVLPAIVGLRLVQGIGFSGSSTAAATVASDLVPASRRSEGIGYYALANTIGMAIGPNLGLALHQGLGVDWLFAASTVFGLVAGVSGLWLRYERRHARSSSTVGAARTAVSPHREGMLRSLVEPSVVPACIVFLFVVMPYGAIMAYVAAFGIHEHVDNVGLFFTVFAVALLLVRVGVGKVTDRFGTTIVFVPGVVLMFAGLIALGTAQGLGTFLVAAALFGLGYGVTLPLLQAAAYSLAPQHRRGVASATFFATADIAYGVGAILLGVAIELFGYELAFMLLAVYAVIALVLYFALLAPRLRRQQSGAQRTA